MKHECYIDEQFDDNYFAVGLRPLDDFWRYELMDWCEANVGLEYKDWGHTPDEFYSPLNHGDIFWFATDESRLLFRIAWTL